MSTHDDDIATYTADELAELLGVNRKTIYEAAARGDIPHRRLGRRLIFERVAILTWLRRTNTASEPARGRDER
jgi:excisionase family DNA binding protein